MYLSRIEVNKQRMETKRALLNLQIMHASVKACFPESDGRILWRADALRHSLYILIVAPIKPDFTAFVRQYGWPESEQTGESRDYKQLLDRIEADSKWRFRLTANPVYAGNGKRYAHIAVDEQKKWLTDRAERNGFYLQEYSFDVVSRDTIKFSKGDKGDRHKVTLSRVAFEGDLTVSDIDLFKSALTDGVGRAKAYGCGMLTVAKLI
jgi:CRISPR system Cascade subunit CasE